MLEVSGRKAVDKKSRLVSGPKTAPREGTGLKARTGPFWLKAENGGYMLQTLKNSWRSNLMLGLLAIEKVADGAGSDPTRKGLALS
ncbi:hypothetical protein RchiOBHm_Chr4g0445211 [Rosa chinensis]|uniref:Uncharacterized protein n=1 Tax=Rosa chinensis TaxID=74649 RepID=A0A2P6R4B9_ROSCH|nr:hypothetical protein RchiOBHm_Chr4g0445211 [Rosa chinensis]